MAKRGFFLLILISILFSLRAYSADYPLKKILILAEGKYSLKNLAVADARQLADLLGHFNTQVTLKGVDEYSKNELNNYNFIFYVGFNRNNAVPNIFVNDVIRTDKPVVWLNTGLISTSKNPEFEKKYRFNVQYIDSVSVFNFVKSNGKIFTKGEETSHIINILDKNTVQILATALSSKKKIEVPYIIKSNNLIYITDSPLGYADETDRYLLFADMLHDILGEEHEGSHSAIVRIEDVNSLSDPNSLREIADLLSSRGIPFLVGVVPIYIDPQQGLRIPLSEKPELIDALKYMVKNGGTIVMHGVTHQYKGVSTADFEFWDGQTNQPIKNETEEDIAKKIDLGLQEFTKNGLYPLLWETPHYTASFKLYNTIAKYFGTSIEQRLSIENADYSQYFPYIINKDLFGQKIFPENLGFVPLDVDDPSVGDSAVSKILRGAKVNLNVRDGFAAFFFHPFIKLSLLKELVDGIQGMGYTFIDLKDYHNWVKMKDRVILSGSQDYSVELDDQYLQEAYFSHNGDLKLKVISKDKYSGKISKHVDLAAGEIYYAHPVEYKEKELGYFENILNKGKKFIDKILKTEEKWDICKPVILWNHYARGAAYNDEASFASVISSLNVKLDTIFIGQRIDLSGYNLLIVPFASIDSLTQSNFDAISAFVRNGGNLITDFNKDLSQDFGIKTNNRSHVISRIRDNYVPDEQINWTYSQTLNNLVLSGDEEILAQDASTDAPVVIGKKIDNGKIIYFNSMFDPYSQEGYSRYPFLWEYIKKYLNLKPFVKRDNLEVFYDYGFRTTVSIENLIKQWKKSGVRIIHAAGWYQNIKYPLDYGKLIKLAHANGMHVYAWIEPPQVDEKFWNKHPEWREKNYKGEDVRPSWRYPMAFNDKICLNAMKNEYLTLLNKYDFDGVNLAEVYFEAGKGFNEPNLFTPMNLSAQQEFKKKFNFDLKNIFNPSSSVFWKNNTKARNLVTNFRISKLNDVYNLLLDEFKKFESSKPGFQIIVTAMDSYGSPELKEYIGVDMDNILTLRKKFDFHLNVEDPENLWSTDPLRYEEIGAKYDSIMGGKSNLLLDLNILSFRKKEDVSPFPTLIQTGTENFLIVKSASIGAPRVVIYSESSINPQDMFFIPYALANDVKYKSIKNGYEFDSPYSFYMSLPPDVKSISINGKVYNELTNGSFLIPSGKNTVVLSNKDDIFSTSEIAPKLISLTGNLTSLSYNLRDLFFSYTSDTRTIACLNREPIAINVDGKEITFIVMKGNDCFSVFLPSGNHQVKMVLGNYFSYGINLTSLWSSVGIAIFGISGVILLIILYVVLKVVKRRALKPTYITNT